MDPQGRLVGIPTLSAIDPQFQTPANGVGFAIPSNRVQLIALQVIETGKETHTERTAPGLKLSKSYPLLWSQMPSISRLL